MTLATSPSIASQFWRNAIPAITAMLVSGIYIITDGIFLGQYVGHQALAAVNFAYPVLSVFFGLGLMLGMGSGSLISIARGKQQLQAAGHALYATLVLTLLLALLGAIAVYWGAEFIITAQGADSATTALALQYINIFAIAAIAPMASIALPMLIRNDDSPNVATLIMIFGALFNVALNYLLIVKLELGLEGAAFATVAANTAVIAFSLLYYRSALALVKPMRTRPSALVKLMGQSLMLGSSLLVMHLYSGFIIALHNRLFIEHGGVTAVSAFAIVGYLMTLYYLFAQGLSEGMQPLVSFFHGAARVSDKRKVVALASKLVIVSGLVWYGLLNLSPQYGISLFNTETEVINSASDGLLFHLSGMFLDGMIALMAVYYMATQQGLKALAVSISNMLVQLPFLWILPKLFGILGVWLALPLSNLLLIMILAPMFYRDLYGSKPSGSFEVAHCR
ncbi:MATE family efflux transporter [Paraferrimonas haliotis]|uniref:MATE family efflux transporter n=1 Tax=Paraferrimonas haliotis TaxID=2013866 RepID=A0AA37WXC5_9GAMM|nr:MATE family efflux transporter [Paraferrimonas haliotis]GLS83284.1 MATE family efflux transporter [Paraferrimonas haliotis]